MVRNANQLAKLVKKKKKAQNWLDFYQIKYSRDSTVRPLMKVTILLAYFLQDLLQPMLIFFSLKKRKKKKENTEICIVTRLVFLDSGERRWTELIFRQQKLRGCP